MLARVERGDARDAEVREAVAAAGRGRAGALRAPLRADGARPVAEPLAESAALAGTATGLMAQPAGVLEGVAGRAR